MAQLLLYIYLMKIGEDFISLRIAGELSSVWQENAVYILKSVTLTL